MEGDQMNKFLLIITSLFLCSFLIAQQDTNFYRIKFTDKNNSPFNIQQPEDFLTEKAINRREKTGIAISVQDLPVNTIYISQILSLNSVEYVTHSNWFNQIVILSNDTNDINTIESLPFVASSEQFLKPSGKAKSKDDKLSILSTKESIVVNPHFPYGKTYAQNHLHHLDYMHDLYFNGQGIDIAVIDAGFFHVNSLIGLKHLFESGQILSTYDFVDKELSISEDHFHGSAVLSVMAGYLEGEFYGTATQAKYHLLRSEDANAEYIIEEDFWVRAAEYADSAGCDIINTSLGYTTFDDSTQNHSYSDLDGNTTLIARASDIASSKGILCVTSAGNLGESEWGYIGTPADADSTLTIGAIDQYNQLAPFSSFGPSADGDIKPNIVSVGWLTQLIAPWDNQIIQGNGTSFSAPMISGLAACLWQALPELSNIELKDLLESTADQHGSPDTLRGYGFPKIFEAYSSQTGITYQNPTGIDIQDIYPNPVHENEVIYIKLSSNADLEVKIILVDILGKVSYVRSSNISSGMNLITIEKGKLPLKGVYSLIIQSEDQISTERIVLH